MKDLDDEPLAVLRGNVWYCTSCPEVGYGLDRAAALRSFDAHRITAHTVGMTWPSE